MANKSTPTTDMLLIEDATLPALDRMVYLKRVVEYLEDTQSELVAKANKEYLAIKIGPAAEWPICNGLATVSDAKPKAKWKYPAEVEAAIERVHKMQLDSQADKSAKNVTVTDPTKNQLFKIWLKDPDAKKK